MKTTADLVKCWVRKGDSDPENVRLCVTSGMALDTACFHAQQAAEKFIKAYMIAYGMSAPFIHNLENLLEKCEQQDTSFSQMKALGQILTPYAVQLRYDGDFCRLLVRLLRHHRPQRCFAHSSSRGCLPRCSRRNKVYVRANVSDCIGVIMW